jgi:pimeloyl-ACP methyl ester carboxylesterase
MAEVMLGDIRIHYLDTGLPDADVILLLLHAFPLQAGMWDEQLRRFGDRYRLIAPDLKGFGGSDAPNDPAAYSVESYADDAAGLLSLLDLERAVVAGQGVLGGQVAWPCSSATASRSPPWSWPASALTRPPPRRPPPMPPSSTGSASRATSSC